MLLHSTSHLIESAYPGTGGGCLPAPAGAWADVQLRMAAWFEWASAYVGATGLRAGRYPLRLDGDQQALYWGSQQVFLAPDPRSLWAVADWCTAVGWSNRLIQNYLVYHAAALERDGQALLLFGPSGSDKSSLTLGLVREGFRYLSDEFAIVDPQTLEALPFPRGLRIPSSGLPGPGESDIDFEVLAYPADFWQRGDAEFCCIPHQAIIPPAGSRFPVRWAVFLLTQPVSAPPRIVPRWEAMKRLYESAGRLNHETFRAIAALARRACFREIGRGSLPAMAAQIRALVDADWESGEVRSGISYH